MNRLSKLQTAAVALMIVLVNFAYNLPAAFAATLMTHATVMEYNMNASGSSAFAIAFTTGAADASTTLTIAFGSWGGTVNGTQTVTTTGCTALTGATTPLPTTGTLSAAGATNTVTISAVNSLTTATSYCAILTSTTALTNPGAGVYPVVITDGTDSATVAIDIITNDQIVVSATVPPSFTLALSGNTDSFTAPLAVGSVTSTTGVTATINTNAKTGWYLWAADSNTGLHSTASSYTIASTSPGGGGVQTLSAGTEGYVFAVTNISQGSGAGTAAATTAFNGTSGSDPTGVKGDGLNGTLTQVATSNGTAATAVLTLKERAAISGTTAAATDYADTVTVVGAGSF